MTAVAAIATMALVAVLVVCESRGSRAGCAIAKTLASTGFVATAWLLGLADSGFGRGILIALALSWLGDVLLLSRRQLLFLAGMGAFLAAHVAFALAFATRPLSAPALSIALASMALFGAAMLRWLWPHLHGPMRAAVPAYVAAIVAMCALAIAAAVGGGAPLLAIGALAFAASDIAVARDRFISPHWHHRAWGLPLYYAAQLALAFAAS